MDAVNLIRNGTGSAITAADVGSAGTQNGCVSALGTTGAEFQNGTALGCADNTVGLGCNQALMVDTQQQECFDELCLNGRSTNGDDRLVGENGSTFRHSPYVASKAEVCQICQEFIAEQISATQVFDVLCREMEILDVIDDLFQACSNRETTAVRATPEEQIKICDAVFGNLSFS